MGDGTYAWGEDYLDGSIAKEEVLNQADADFTIAKFHIADGTYAWGEDYSEGDRVKEQVNNVNDADETYYRRHTQDGTYAWGEDYLAGSIAKEEVNAPGLGITTRDRLHIADGTYSWGEDYFEGDVVKVEVNNANEADDIVYSRHAQDGTYAWGEDYDQGDIVKEEVNAPGPGITTRDRLHIADGTYSWGEDYFEGDVVKVEVNNANEADDIVYSRHAQDGTYAWGEDYDQGDIVKTRTQVGTQSVPIPGEFDEWGEPLTEEQPVYQFDDVIAAYTKNVEVHTRDIVDAYTKNSEVHTRDIVDAYTRNVSTFTRNRIDYYTQDQEVHTRDIVDYYTQDQEVHTRDIVDYYTQNQEVHTRDIVDYYTQDQEVHTRNIIDYYTQDQEVHTRNIVDYYTKNENVFTRDKVGVFARNVYVNTAYVETDPIRRYLGETAIDPQPQVHTGWEQDTYEFIPNWYFSDDNRVLFGPGDTNGSFTITDTENGTLINSSTEDGSYVDNSKTISVPTPSWEDMASPAYLDYVVNSRSTNVSDPDLEDRDDHPLQFGPGGVFTTPSGRQINYEDPDIGLIDSNGGKALELNTGGLVFDEGNGFGIYHGPAIVSDPFEILEDQPKIVRLDYSALGENDDYHVAGYIYEINPNTGAAIIDPDTNRAKITMAVNETGKSVNGRAGIEVNTPGHYRFVFVVGTHDLTGGLVAGANMTVDNIVAEDPYAIGDKAIQELLRAVHYENSASIAAPTKTLTATVESGDQSLFVRDKALIDMKGFGALGSDGPYMIVPSLDFTTQPSEGGTDSALVLTKKIEVVQGRLNLARTQAGSQYATLEEAIASTTDLRSQFALGSGTLSDLNFSVETVNLTRRQMQKDVASAVLAQANKTQSSLVSLVDGSYRTYLNAQFSHLK